MDSNAVANIFKRERRGSFGQKRYRHALGKTATWPWKQKLERRTSLVVQWLRLHAPNAGGPGSAPGQETRSDKAQLKIPSGATKTQSSQINQSVKQTTLPCPPAPQGPRQGPSCPLHDHSVCCERLLLGTALQPWVHQPPSPARVLAGVSGARGSAPIP